MWGFTVTYPAGKFKVKNTSLIIYPNSSIGERRWAD
jgi:hypothetical protein